MTNQQKAEQLADAEIARNPDVWPEPTDRARQRDYMIKEALGILGKPDSQWRSEGKAKLAAESIHESYCESFDNSDLESPTCMDCGCGLIDEEEGRCRYCIAALEEEE
jgi:hypothetical protein